MWIDCKEKMPESMEVVIVLYVGSWPGRGCGGIADAYATGVEWYVPEGVNVVGWMPIPDVNHLTTHKECSVALEHKRSTIKGFIDSDDHDFLEAIFVENDSNQNSV
ncbi:DUF551 domain-containing protein [Endozoicomonas lisbonensis]|uniref:DUF551 domain-containing protein n=1 Tax=Endozoicomonas lisbonensis TaxID=3120522 RepID=A0ABV2SL46_9GAMM